MGLGGSGFLQPATIVVMAIIETTAAARVRFMSSPAELVFFVTSNQRMRSEQLVQRRFVRLFLLNLLRLICLFTL